jgi:hypothetical protein
MGSCTSVVLAGATKQPCQTLYIVNQSDFCGAAAACCPRAAVTGDMAVAAARALIYAGKFVAAPVCSQSGTVCRVERAVS